MPLDDYKEKYNLIFEKDLHFGNKFTPLIHRILNIVNIPLIVRDNLGSNLDKKGHDLTLKPIEIGMRVRKYKYLSYNQFTQDDKERNEMDCDYYFFGYATYKASIDKQFSDLIAYILFDYQDYKKLRDTKIIPCKARMQNKEHSSVWFNCYSLEDIEKNCRIILKSGPIGLKIVHPEKLDFYLHTQQVDLTREEARP